MGLIAVIFWLFLCVLIGIFAHKRGRFGFGWGIVSLTLSPLVGWLIVLALPDVGKSTESKDGLGNAITEATHKRCPACREVIRRDALKCRHCGEVIPA